MRSLSEQRRLEEVLYHAHRMEAVGRLAGVVAHEFNNLLTVITSSTAILLERHRVGDPDHELLDAVKSAIDRGATLTRQLTSASRERMASPRALNVNETIEGAANILRRLAGHRIVLQLALDPTVDLIHGDPGRIEQLLVNLAVNARDAMPEGGILRIATSRSTRYVVMTVSDTGQGMTPDVLAHAFEPFFTTKESGCGTGLGLATVQSVAAEIGGFIRVESEPGVGSRFFVYLPEYEHPPAAA